MTDGTYIEVRVFLTDPDLDDERLQAKVLNLKSQIKEVDGVEQVGLVPVEQAPPDSKSVSGYVLGMFKILVDAAQIKPLFDFLVEMVRSKNIEITVKKPDGVELTIKVSSREDFEFAYQKAQEFIGG